MRPLKQSDKQKTKKGVTLAFVFSEQTVLNRLLGWERGPTKGWEAIGLARLGEGRVHGGLGQRRIGHLAGVRRHCRAKRKRTSAFKKELKSVFTCIQHFGSEATQHIYTTVQKLGVT